MSPDQQSPQSQKLAESLVLLEFIADLYPDASLLPKDPVLRAKARFFINTVAQKFVPSHESTARDPEIVLPAVEYIQTMLPQEGYAIGPEWSIADASITPFAARLDVMLKYDIGVWKEGQGKKVYDTLQNDPKYARFKKYFEDVTSRPSFQETFDEVRYGGLSIRLS